MWEGKKSLKDFVEKIYKDGLISKVDLEECINSYEKEEENILRLLFTDFCDGIFMYLNDFPCEIKRMIIHHEEAKTVEGRNYITIKYNDNYYNIGYKITKGSWSYCEKTEPTDEYIDFSNVLSYYKKINILEKENIRKLVKKKY